MSQPPLNRLTPCAALLPVLFLLGLAPELLPLLPATLPLLPLTATPVVPPPVAAGLPLLLCCSAATRRRVNSADTSGTGLPIVLGPRRLPVSERVQRGWFRTGPPVLLLLPALAVGSADPATAAAAAVPQVVDGPPAVLPVLPCLASSMPPPLAVASPWSEFAALTLHASERPSERVNA